MKKHIPNTITCLNLLSGCVAITAAFSDRQVIAAIMIGVAGFFDFFDGMSARLLNVKSDIGKELDSLADVVSFGVVPGVIVFKLLQHSAGEFQVAVLGYGIVSYIGFMIPVFSALRLAKFNLDERQTDSFIGVPTPANALLIGSFPLILWQMGCACSGIFLQIKHLIYSPFFLVPLTIVMSLLLVSELPLFAMKFKNLKWHDNKIRFIFLGLSILLIIIFRFIAIPLIIFLYILLSLISRKKGETVQ